MADSLEAPLPGSRRHPARPQGQAGLANLIQISNTAVDDAPDDSRPACRADAMPPSTESRAMPRASMTTTSPGCASANTGGGRDGSGFGATADRKSRGAPEGTRACARGRRRHPVRGAGGCQSVTIATPELVEKIRRRRAAPGRRSDSLEQSSGDAGPRRQVLHRAARDPRRRHLRQCRRRRWQSLGRPLAWRGRGGFRGREMTDQQLRDLAGGLHVRSGTQDSRRSREQRSAGPAIVSAAATRLAAPMIGAETASIP